MKLNKKVLIGLAIVFILDRLLKYWAINKLPAAGIFIFEKFGGLGLKFSKNYGLAFGIPLPEVLVYVFLSSCVLVLFYLLLKNWRLKNFNLVLVLIVILAGALSNLIDRLVYGYVVDYINLFIWPVFNLSDIMIVGGVAGWLVWEWRGKDNKNN